MTTTPLSTLNSELSTSLVPLSDGRPGLRATIPVQVSAPPPLPSDGRGIKGEGQPTSDTLDFISSDETLDRYNEIITASGWNLASDHRNPVFQNAHQYGDIIFTLGKALITEVRTRQSAICHLPSAISDLSSVALLTKEDRLSHGAVRSVRSARPPKPGEGGSDSAPKWPCQKPSNALPYTHGSRRIHNRLQDPGSDVLAFPISRADSIPTLYAKAGY